MAEGKKSFVLYTDLIHTVKHLSNEQSGELFKHILSYVNDENPTTDNVIVNLAFEPVKQQLKRDLRKYESYINKQKANGKKGGRPKAKETQKTQAFISKPKKADSVNVNDTVSTYVDKKEIEVEVDDPQVISISYEEIDFLKNWNEARIYFLDTPSNLNKLRADESDLFWSAKNEFTKDDFHKAMKGLFKQERVPSDIMVFRPKHFLGNIETYLDAENNKRYKLYA